MSFPRCILLVALLFAGCGIPRPQRGGESKVTFGGVLAPSSVTNAAPENPQTPSTTTVEKTITREFAPAAPRPETHATSLQTPTSHVTGAGAAAVAPTAAGASLLVAAPAQLVREVVTEKATTQTGSSWKDTVRELGARLANMRAVMWVGVALLIGGPVAGWKMGWLTNGLIAGAVGLVLIILAQVVPGHEVWFALGGLLLIPLVAFVYYRAQHDVRGSST